MDVRNTGAKSISGDDFKLYVDGSLVKENNWRFLRRKNDMKLSAGSTASIDTGKKFPNSANVSVKLVLGSAQDSYLCSPGKKQTCG